MDKQYWWCGWTVPDGLPIDDPVREWPGLIQGWCTGLGEGFENWTGVVWAASAEDARQVVLSCYGESAGQIVERWEPDPKGETWEPTRRFPDPDGAAARIESLKQAGA